MFGIKSTPQDTGNCSCSELNLGNRPRVKSTFSPGLTACLMGWDTYCRIPDYDELAKAEVEEEGE